jgi:hypothetical protein
MSTGQIWLVFVIGVLAGSGVSIVAVSLWGWRQARTSDVGSEAERWLDGRDHRER